MADGVFQVLEGSLEVLDIGDSLHEGLLVRLETQALLDFSDHVLEESGVEVFCGLFANEFQCLHAIDFLSKPPKINSFINVSGFKSFSISFHFSCLFQRLNSQQFFLSVFENFIIPTFV